MSLTSKKKLFLVTTVPMSFIFFKGQLLVLEKEYDITLVSSPEEELYQTAELNNIKCYGLTMKREISLIQDFKSLVKLVIYFYKSKPNVVHGNTPKAGFLSILASWICKVPTRIYFIHGLRYQGENGLKRKLLIYMEKISCKLATDVFAVSNGVKQVLSADNITSKDVNVIWNGSINGLDIAFFNPEIIDCSELKKQYNIKDEDFVFGFIGRIVADKGINELVLAFKKINLTYPNSKLLLVGSFEETLDPLLPETNEEINKNKNIIVAGFHKDIRAFYKMMNLFVFPSYREGFGISLMEAAAMKTPAISSNIIGCNEIIEDSVNGFLISSKNEDQLYEKMRYSLQNKIEIEKMGNKAREIIISKFEQNQLWSKTIEIYKQIIN